jgi:CRISPR-associated endonuclease/helicase Cas3
VTLAQHGTAVGARARQIATNLGLPPHLVAAAGLAAEWHDLGKAEPRFQAMLHRGDRLLATLAPEPLAKSGMVDEDPGVYRLARERSGLPAGARHEAWSARAALALLDRPDPDRWLPPGADPDLVVHLVASHHGHSRPLLPPVTDSDPTTFAVTVDGTSVTVASTPTIDWQAPARFARLNDRYGRWGLALLEAIVRQADITCSRDGT